MFKQPTTEQKAQQELKRKHEEEKREQLLQEHFLKLSVFEKLDEFLKKEEIKNNAPTERKELLTLTSSGVELDTNGFTYSYLFVSFNNDREILTLDLNGVTSQLVLSQGLNSLPLVDGMRVISQNPTTVVFIQSMKELHTEKRKKQAIEVTEKTGNYTHNFKQFVTGLVVSNDDATNSISVKVDSEIIKVNPNEILDIDLKAFKSIEFTAAGSYRFYGRV